MKKLWQPVIIQTSIWTIVVLLSFVWKIAGSHTDMRKLAIEVAKTYYKKDLTYRAWNAFHGGVYVPVTEKTQPNEYLDGEYRDVTTTNGLKLTMVNPSYMTRQAYELVENTEILSSHLTSLRPKRPENHADEWETKALISFEEGKDEYYTFYLYNGEEHLRYMKPFYIEEGCLKCHAEQEYKVGDVRGGISFLVPMAPYYSIYKKEQLLHGIEHFSIWAIGFLIVYLFAIRTKREIEQERAAEEKLRLSEERFKALHNASFGGIFIHDKKIILECNKGLSTLTGYSYEELIGMDGLNLVSEKSRATVVAHMSSGSQSSYEAIASRKDGKEYPVRIEARNIPYKGIEARVVEFRDISEHRKLEEELRQAQKMESIGHLAGGIAHDFNNLLTPIIGGTELIMMKLDKDSPLIQDLEAISNTAFRASELTRQILAFSRKQVLKVDTVHINDVISNFISILRRTIHEDISIQSNLGTISKFIKVDVSQFEQILMNLALNAQDAITQNGSISINTREININNNNVFQYDNIEEGDYIVLEFKDNGSGISEENLNKIFDPFFTTKSRSKGTGLGLSTVYGIVKQHNGTIHVTSKEGFGTVFTILFPVTDDVIEIQITDVDLIHDYSGSETIVIVEDQEQVRNIAKAILVNFGYRVFTFEKGPDCIEAAKNGMSVPDLLLTDIIMPEMNGKEVAEAMQEIYPGIRVLFMSGYTSDVIEKKGILDKEINFILKPLTVKSLARKVKEVLSFTMRSAFN